MKYIAMLSGGQDSTAMTLRLLEIGEPVDYIVFADTGIEFDEMYKYIDKLDQFFQRKYGITITRIKPEKDIKDWYLTEVTRGENEGKIRGMPLIASPCYWRREVKDVAFQKWIKANGITEYKKYIGFVLHEVDRWEDAVKYNAICPLVEWNWNENEVKKYLRENMMENKLYSHFSRTGCAICPKQSDSFYHVYKYYPSQWEKAKQIEKEIYDLRKKRGEKQIPAYHPKKFSWQLEKEFIKKDKTPELDLGFYPVQDCFCKI